VPFLQSTDSRALRSTPSLRKGFFAATMSDDSEDNKAEAPAAKPARKKPAARKAAKPKPEAAKEASFPLVEAPAAAVESAPSTPARAEEREPREGGPEPIPFFVENSASEAPGNPKKRRRRKKKHGQSQQPQHPHAVSPPSDVPPAVAESAPAPVMHAAPRPKLDADEVAKKAWKIFQSEVGEEGLALIDDHDAREISRRCFRLAEIFLDEAARRNR
jgi:hypothetical protein